jgi:hypothetical protein
MADVSENWQDGELWILAVGGSNKAYKFTVPAGTCTDSIGDPTWTSTSQRGLTYDPFNSKFWVGGWNSNMVWEINTDGTPTGRQFSFNNVASLAYDWQSTIHPEPVLWVATNEASNYIYMVDSDNPQPAITLLWDFEDGWQGWTHTNGQSFPAAWGVEASDIHGVTWQIPSSGDSSMWIDSDTAGSGTWVKDTALSPVLVPDATTEWLKYGLSYRILSSDWLEVGLKYFDGADWNVTPLKTYTNDVTQTWDSIDVSAYNIYDSIQIYFYYDDNNTWAWYAAFDNVMINGDTTGIIEETKDDIILNFGFAPDMPTVTKHPTIVYTTITPGKVCLKIYDNTGRLIKTLVDRQNEPAGTKTIFWDGKDDIHRNVANGIYFFKLDVEEKSATHKVIYIK